MTAEPKSWVLFSSSSGETFRAFYSQLSPELKNGLKACFFDRDCAAIRVSEEIAPHIPRLKLDRPHFEAQALKALAQLPEGPVLLCGFFSILSSHFLRESGRVVVNTHPSLLPAFPGKDEKVHAAAFESVTVSGWTLHLVNEALDGGPILFQHPVLIEPQDDLSAMRNRVRLAEQYWLPHIWGEVLKIPFVCSDRHLSTRELQKKYQLKWRSFESLQSKEIRL
jgi:phosphoribosylglycinamide formyltransferase-1